MVIMLDTGYISPRAASWPKPRGGYNTDTNLKNETGLEAGLGLGWLNAGIMGRRCLLQKTSLTWLEKLAEQLSNNELKSAMSSTFNPRDWFWPRGAIHGVLNWGGRGLKPHNRLALWSIEINDSPLLDPNRPTNKKSPFSFTKFEILWFRQHFHVKGDLCALEEWIDPQEKVRHKIQIAVFDGRTGIESTDPRIAGLRKVEDLEKLEF